jgi:hypothetical protein
VVVLRVVLDFLPNTPPKIDDLVEVDVVLVDGVVGNRAEMAPELGFSVVVFLCVKKRLIVSIRSSIKKTKYFYLFKIIPTIILINSIVFGKIYFFILKIIITSTFSV